MRISIPTQSNELMAFFAQTCTGTLLANNFAKFRTNVLYRGALFVSYSGTLFVAYKRAPCNLLTFPLKLLIARQIKGNHEKISRQSK